MAEKEHKSPREDLMRRAIELAVANVDKGGGPFGAVVAREGVIIGEGVNRVTLDNDPSAHAEVLAIREACRGADTYVLDDCELYTSCEPCPMCLGAIYWARLSRVYYASTRHDAAAAGFDDAALHREFTAAPRERTTKLLRLQYPESSHAFERWADTPDKTPY